MKKTKALLVIGGVSGIGLAVAKKFLQEQTPVIITSTDYDLANKRAQELTTKYNTTCIGVKYQPLSAKQECADMFATILDKGYVVDKLLCAEELTLANQDSITVDLYEWEKIIKANVTGAFIPTRLMTKQLAKQGESGSIVLLGSTLDNSAVPNKSAYISSKGGVSSMTRALAIDYSKHNVRVNCVSVGAMQNQNFNNLDSLEQQRIKGLMPLGNLVSEQQVANAVWFLLSNLSSGITGSNLVVDGGLDCRITGAF